MLIEWFILGKIIYLIINIIPKWSMQMTQKSGANDFQRTQLIVTNSIFGRPMHTLIVGKFNVRSIICFFLPKFWMEINRGMCTIYYLNNSY